VVPLPPHAIPIKFSIDDDAAVLWAYPDMPPPSPGVATLHDFYIDPSLKSWAASDDDDGSLGGKCTSVVGRFDK